MYYEEPDAQSAEPEHHDSDETVTVDRVIDVAVEEFARDGFHEAKLENVARISGMSKRMIHYHFGDKKGLYHRALVEAISRLHPDSEAMELDSSVPVEGVRKLVDGLYGKFVEHPEAVRMLLMENVHHILEITELAPLVDESSMSLHLDKLLMLGQDAGAFRPGISSDDVFLLMTSVSVYRIANRDMSINLFGVDMASEENTAGLHRFVVDAVLAFLTSNIPDTGHRSYLSRNMMGSEPQSALGIYGSDRQDIFGDN